MKTLKLALLQALLLTSLPAFSEEPIYRQETYRDGEYVKFGDNTSNAEIRSIAQEIISDYTRTLTNKCTSSPYYGQVTKTDVTYGSVKPFCLMSCVYDQMVTVHVTCRYRDTYAEKRSERNREERAQEEREEESARQAKQKLSALKQAERKELAERFCENTSKQGSVLLCTEKNGSLSRWAFSGTVVPSQTKVLGTLVCPRSRLNCELLSCDFGPRGVHFYKKAVDTSQEDAPRQAENNVCIEEEAGPSSSSQTRQK